MAGNGWNMLESLEWLEMAGNGWKWLEMAGNSWQWLAMAGSGWKWQERLEMA